jgi:hypothetical protein
MPRRRYAEATKVPTATSKAAIETLLVSHGATAYATGWDAGHDTIQFELFHRTIRFVLPRPDAKDRRFTHDKHGWSINPSKRAGLVEQADRQRWRALYIVIRAKIEAVEAGIAVFEQEFLAFVVLPNGLTIGDSLVPMLKEGRELPALGPPRDTQ